MVKNPNNQFYLNIPSWLICYPGLSWNDRAVWSYISYREGDNNEAWPGIDRMVSDLDISKPTVIKSLRKLNQKGLIYYEPSKGGRTHSNHYQTVKKLDSLEDINSKKTLPFKAINSKESLPQTVNKLDRKNKKEKEQKEITIPDELNTPKFLDTWKQWQQYRRELGKPLTPTITTRQLKKLAEHDVETAINMLEQSMEREWRGIWELKGDGKAKVTDFTGGDPRMGHIPGWPMPGSEG